MSDNQFPLSTQRHSFAHLLAQAVQRFVDPAVQLGTGPSTENGFYYDMLFAEGVEFGEKDLKNLTKMLQLIAKEPQTYVRYDCSIHEGYEINSLTNQSLKSELLDKFKAKGETEISYYLNVVPVAVLDNARNVTETRQELYREVTKFFQEQGTISSDQAVVFLDLCAGPHVSLTKEDLEPLGVKLEKLAGAYRQADEDNAMMTRVYGLCFESKQALKDYEHMMEEARKRDHRKLGKTLKLFTTSELIGAGLPLMMPNGMIIRTEIIDFLWSLHKKKGYKQVRTPHLAKEELYQCSGHAEKFGDELFRVQGKEDKFFMKPMNCPHHMQIFAANQFSYRDMPVRYFEPGTVYRDEKSGQLSGLTRVRAITQDDGHLFCRIGQIQEEVSSIVEIIRTFYTTVGMADEYWVQLSVRGGDTKYLGSNEVRETAEGALEAAAKANDLSYKRVEGEAAFYGPKLDFMFKDSIGRERQLATIQCDFNLPERFDLSFTNEAGEKERPVVIHRAVSGSLERFMGVMIEHFAGAFPVWLAPTQAIILPVAETFREYADELNTLMITEDLRASVDTSGDSLSKMVRNAEKMKIPYILIVGQEEVDNQSVSIREYKTKEQSSASKVEVIEMLVSKRDQRSL